MRMGPFANNQVINYLNKFYVPVFVSNEDYQAGKFGEENHKLLFSVWDQAKKKKLPMGTVHAYLLTPDGKIYNSMHVMHAARLDVFFRFITSAIGGMKTAGGETLVQPAPTFVPPSVEDDEILLHAASQYGNRSHLAAEDWIVLSKEEWTQFVPPEKTDSDGAWSISEEVAQKIMIHLYPYAADWNNDLEQITRAEIKLYPLTAETSETKATYSVKGIVQMTRNRQAGRLPEPVSAQLLGLVTVQSDAKEVKPKFVLSTGDAFYGREPFSSLLRSVPGPNENATNKVSSDAVTADAAK